MARDWMFAEAVEATLDGQVFDRHVPDMAGEWLNITVRTCGGCGCIFWPDLANGTTSLVSGPVFPDRYFIAGNTDDHDCTCHRVPEEVEVTI